MVDFYTNNTSRKLSLSSVRYYIYIYILNIVLIIYYIIK